MDAVAILSCRKAAETCGGVDLLGPVKRSAALLMAGAVDYEFRTTVCAPLHTPEEMAGIGRWLKGAKRYFLCGLRRTGGQRHEAPDKRRDRSAAGQRFA